MKRRHRARLAFAGVSAITIAVLGGAVPQPAGALAAGLHAPRHDVGANADQGAAYVFASAAASQHFLLYQLDQPEAAGETVTLVDRFGALTVRLEEAEWLLNPAEKRRAGQDPEPIQEADEHLVCYGLPYISTADRSVIVQNQFGESTLRVGRPLALCTPAAATPSGNPGPPPGDLDHFLCYDVRGETPLFPSETLDVSDELGSRTVRIDRARVFCTPAEKRRQGQSPEPIIRPDEQIVCYRITTQSPAFTGANVVANDQFSSLQALRVRTLERLCVPSEEEVTAPAGVKASFSSNGVLAVFGDVNSNSIVISRNAAGAILVNGGAVPVLGGPPTVANTSLIQVFGGGGDDAIDLDEANGALPTANLFGGADNDTLTGGAGGDLLFGQSGNDTMLGRGGPDLLFGGAENDTLTGGDADDQVGGESGNDRMIWNPGDDTDLNEGGDGTDVVEVNGGGGAEVFTVTANGTRVRFDRLDPAPFALDIGTSEKLVLNANAGGDSFSATGNLAGLIEITVDGGAGDDTILGSTGADLLLGGDDDDFVDGRQGNDVVFLGADADVFQWNPGDGSDVVEGQDGTDTMRFNGANVAENIDIAAAGGRVRFFRDVASVTMDLDDVETIDFRALGGADTLTVSDLSGTDVVEVNDDLAGTLGGAAGDGQADTVVVTGTDGDDIIDVGGAGTSVSVVGLAARVNIANSDGANDSLVINTLDGNDSVNATTLPAGIIKLTIN
jgi:Ca2+-binding RTX toxin-like protein